MTDPAPTPADRKNLIINEVTAGISMAFVLIPQALAYARVAGLPPEAGLYAAALPPLIAAFFASSPYLQTGPTAVTSILVSAGLLALPGQFLADPFSRQYVLLAALLALIVGVIRVAIGAFKAGKIVYLMSEPVLRGFMIGASLMIVLSQLPGLLGLSAPADVDVKMLPIWVLQHASEWSLETVIVAAAAYVITRGASRLHPLAPGVLIATIGGIVYSLATGYEARGAVVGAIPAGLPLPELRLPWASFGYLVLPGVVIALVGFSEAASIARTYAARERQRWDPDRDFISQGAANLAAGMFGGFPVGGSFTRSGLAHMIGVRTRWSGAVTGAVVLIFTPFASVLRPIPTAVLAAMVIAAVLRYVRMQPLLELWRLSRLQFIVGTSTFVLTVLLSPNIHQAVLLGILIAIGVHLWREFTVRLHHWMEDDALHVRPEGVLWFGSAQALEQQVLEKVAAHPDAKRLVLHMERLGRVDLTASLVIATLVSDVRSSGLDTEVVAIHPTTAKALHRVLREGRRAETAPRPER
jgi:sulfate permease, SulP family